MQPLHWQALKLQRKGSQSSSEVKGSSASDFTGSRLALTIFRNALGFTLVFFVALHVTFIITYQAGEAVEMGNVQPGMYDSLVPPSVPQKWRRITKLKARKGNCRGFLSAIVS